MPPIGIIDTHIHFIDPKQFHYPWLARRPDVDRLFLADDYRQVIGQAHVVKVVLVEAAARDEDSPGEAEWLAQLAATDPLVGAVVAQARLERGDAVEDELQQLAKFESIRGIRRVVRAPFRTDPDFCVRPDFISGVRRLSRYGYSFDVACGPGDLANVSQLADACPDVILILNHMANPPHEEAGFRDWSERMIDLARRRNVACKLSGLPVHLPKGWDASTIAPFVEVAASAFGPDRILFGSDTPVQNAGGGFTRWLEALCDLRLFNEDEQRKFYSGNASRLYRIAPVD
jgi:L-fuconolactonase